MRWRVFGAAAVHFYTTIGGILAFAALVEIARNRFERALLLLGLAYIVDGTDGFLARRVQVDRALPNINGEILDLVIDFITYAIAPLFLLWRAELLPSPSWLWALLILIAAHYDFAKTHPLKHRGLYTGLPAIWNVYAFHVLYVRPSELTQMICIALLLVLTFAPVHFIVVSRLPYLRTISTVALVAYIMAYLLVMLGLVENPRRWALIAVAFPAWYIASSLWVTFKFRRSSLSLPGGKSHELLP